MKSAPEYDANFPEKTSAPAAGDVAPRILVVVHGSRNHSWVETQREWFRAVRRTIEAVNSAAAARLELSFLEITAPLFLDRLQAIAQQRPEPGAPPLLIFPFFLSQSFHVGEEIPGMARAALDPAGVAWRIIEPLGWEARLGASARRRLLALGARPESDAVIVCGYGSSSHNERWLRLLADVQAAAGEYAAGARWLWVPCGHFSKNKRQRLLDALAEAARQRAARAAILPLFLGVSSYQTEFIPSVIAENRALPALFRPDAVLPDPAIEDWAAGRILSGFSNSTKTRQALP